MNGKVALISVFVSLTGVECRLRQPDVSTVMPGKVPGKRAVDRRGVR